MSDISHPTTGAVRESSIYVSYVTRKALGYIPRTVDESIDSIAEKVLSDWLKATHPKIIEHIEKQREADKLFRDGLKQKPF